MKPLKMLLAVVANAVWIIGLAGLPSDVAQWLKWLPLNLLERPEFYGPVGGIGLLAAYDLGRSYLRNRSKSLRSFTWFVAIREQDDAFGASDFTAPRTSRRSRADAVVIPEHGEPARFLAFAVPAFLADPVRVDIEGFLTTQGLNAFEKAPGIVTIESVDYSVFVSSGQLYPHAISGKRLTLTHRPMPGAA